MTAVWREVFARILSPQISVTRSYRLFHSAGVTAASHIGNSWDPTISLRLEFPVLHFLEKCTIGSKFKMILAHMLRLHLTFQTFPMSRLLYFSTVSFPEYISEALLLFQHFSPHPNLYIYNMMIGAVSYSEEKSLALYKSMLLLSMRPDVHIFLSLLKPIRCVSVGKQIHVHILTRGFGVHLYVQNSLIKMYTELGKTDLAEMLFLSMPCRDIVSYNIMLSGCARKGFAYKVFDLFHEMDLSGIMLDDYTIVPLIMCCGQLKDLLLGKSIHGLTIRRNLKNLHLSNALLDMYANCKDMSTAKRLFDMSEADDISWNTMVAGFADAGLLNLAYDIFSESPVKTTLMWNALLTGYCQENYFKRVLELFKDMLVSRILFDEVTLVTLLSAIAGMGMSNIGRSVHGWVVKDYGYIDAFLGSALINMYCKCGDINRAYAVFVAVADKDVTLWTAMIAGLALNGHSTKSLELFSNMQEEGSVPNGVTLVAVLTACNHAGLVNDGYHIFKHMKQKFNINPEPEHYGCMVDLLARSGRLDEAMNLVANMKTEPTKEIWGAILSASRELQNTEVGEIASRALLRMEPSEEGAYILLANIYAAEGQWSQSIKVRNHLDCEAVKKTAGLSIIVVDGVISKFLSSDTMHPKRSMASGLLCHLHRIMRDKVDLSILL